MASPVADSYSCATGDVMAGGRSALFLFEQTELSEPAKFWTQYSSPQAIVMRRSLYLGWTDMTGATGITKHDLVTGATTEFLLKSGSGTANGHDSSSISFLADGRILAMWANHNSTLQCRISDNPYDISSFGAITTIYTSTIVSYCWINELSITGKKYVHFRSGSGGGPGDRPCKVRATLDGVTSDTERSWIVETGERPYVMSNNNGIDRIDFFCTSKHQTDSGPAAFGLYHCYMLTDAAGNETFYKSDGTYISTGSVHPTTQMTQIWDGSTIAGWNWDINYGNDGHPRVLWMKMVTPYDHRHMFSRWDGDSWVTTEMPTANTILYSGETWSDGGLCFDSVNTDRVFRGVKPASVCELQCWETLDNGETWAKAYDVTSGNPTDYKNFGPRTVKNEAHAGLAAWMSGTITFWDTFNTSLFAEHR